MKRFLHYSLCCILSTTALAALWTLFHLEGQSLFSVYSLHSILGVLPYTLCISIFIFTLSAIRHKKPVSDIAEAEVVSEAEDLLPQPVSPRNGFEAIAGYQPVKDYLRLVAKKLADPERRQSLPHGILLYGPPGTGKTLFAKAMAGEVNCPFFNVTASEFTNRLVGQGARNVRRLYAAARKHPVSIVFIDEIDAIGQARKGETNQEERMTLNQLLSELDGFNKEGAFVLTIAATNDFDHLDDALIRAGRFDRRLSIPAPNHADRKAILEAQKVIVSSKVSFEELAVATETFSGAKLASLMREAQTAAEARGSVVVDPVDIDLAIIRVMTHGEPVKVTDSNERRATAYHEAGHVLAAKLLLGQLVPKVSIMGSTSGMAGWTLHVWPKEQEARVKSREDMENEIILYYSGRAAELMAGVPLNAGSKSDIHVASEQIRALIQNYGFMETPLDTSVFSGTEVSTAITAKDVANRLYAKTEQFLQANKSKLDAVAQALLKYETLDDARLNRILDTA